jgi:hypothetical protein
MPVLAAATTPAQLDSVSQRVREWWFEPHAITEQPAGELQIPLSIASGMEELVPTRWLRIRRVTAHRVKASPQVPAYDIYELLYQPAKSQLQIRTGIPLDFEVDVEALDVDVVEPSPG